MKYVWWPGISETLSSKWNAQNNHSRSLVTPLQLWKQTRFCKSGSISRVVIEELKSRSVLLETIVTENSTSFVSEEFEYHFCHTPPSIKSLAEQDVQFVKRRLKKVTEGSIGARL